MQNFVRFHALESEIELPQEFWEKRGTLLSYMYRNRIIAFSNDTYFVYNFFSNFNQWKQRSAYPKYFRKSGSTAPPEEQFLSKVDRHQFTLGSH